MTSGVLEDVLHTIQGESSGPSWSGFDSSLFGFLGLFCSSRRLSSGAPLGLLSGGFLFNRLDIFLLLGSLGISLLGEAERSTVRFD